MSQAEGTVALVGGGEWTPGCSFDAGLLAESGTDKVVVVPTAAAYERPERLVVRAGEWFEGLGVAVEGLMVLSRGDAEDSGAAALLRGARLIYLAGESSLHFLSVLKSSAVWEALLGAWRDGAVVAASSGAAMAIVDPMVDARGGGLTVGLGMLPGLAVLPHFGDRHEDGHGEKLHRAVVLAPRGTPVAGIPERTALVRRPGGRWEALGEGEVTVYRDGALAPSGLGTLPS